MHPPQAMSGSLVWGGCAEVGDACIAAWFGVDGQMWEMHALQHGLGWMGRGGRYSHGSLVWGGYAEVGDACMSAWFGVDGQRWEMHAWQPGLGVDRQRWEMHAW